MHRLRRVRAGMPGRGNQAGHRDRPREMARAQRRICGEVAEHHREEGWARRRQGARRRERQVREILQRRARPVSALAAKLAQARAEARALAARDAGGEVASVADAYRVQDALAAKAGAVRAWKVSALIPEQQRGYPTDRPVGGALFAPYCHETPARVALKSFVAPLMECEIAFLLGRDLAARETPYTRVEIADAVEAMVPAIEIADCRWSADASDLLKLADDMGNGAFIAGNAVRD